MLKCRVGHKPLGKMLLDGKLASSDHLDADPLLEALLNGVFGVVAGRVEQRQQADHIPGVIATLPSHSLLII